MPPSQSKFIRDYYDSCWHALEALLCLFLHVFGHFQVRHSLVVWGLLGALDDTLLFGASEPQIGR